MVGIFGLGPEQKNAAGDLIAHEGAALADPFIIAVVFEEALAEIGAGIGLPPAEFASQGLDCLDKGAGFGAANRARPRSAATTGGERATTGRAINSRGQSHRNASAFGADASNSRKA